MRLAVLLTTVMTVATAYSRDEDWIQLAQFTLRLAFELQPHYGQSQDNSVFSPLAISTSLAMVYGAARGQTANKLRDAFGLGLVDDIHQVYQEYYQQHHHYTWAYGVYVHQNYTTQYSYQDLIQTYYKTPLHAVDFSQGATARLEINQDVKITSNGKFPEYLEQELSPQTQLYYLSAAYYAGGLKHHTGKSYNGRFHIHGDLYKQVPFWTIRGPLFYYYSKDYTAVRIPFHDNDKLSLFVVISENYHEKIKEIYTIMDFLYTWDQMNRTNVEVHLPLFSLEDYQPLSDVFESAGFDDIFEEGADFSGLSSRNIHVSQMDHRAHFKLELPTGQDSHHSHYHTVKFDQPFVFYVVDHTTLMVHFSGYVSNPKNFLA